MTRTSKPEGIGIALKMGDVAPKRRTHLFAEPLTLPIREIGLDGTLTGMSEWRIAHVVRQTGGGDDGADLLEERPVEMGMALNKLAGHIVAQRHAHTRHFQAVCQTVMNENAAWKGENLGLALKTAERG